MRYAISEVLLYYTACASCGMPVVYEPRNRLLRTPPTILLYNMRGRVGAMAMTGRTRVDSGVIATCSSLLRGYISGFPSNKGGSRLLTH